MGHERNNLPTQTTVFVGLARLPQPPVAPTPAVAVELEVETATRRIVAVDTNLRFPLLERILQEALLGQPVEAVERRSLGELERRYCAPFATAVRTAVLAAARRANEGLAKTPAAAPVLRLGITS